MNASPSELATYAQQVTSWVAHDAQFFALMLFVPSVALWGFEFRYAVTTRRRLLEFQAACRNPRDDKWPDSIKKEKTRLNNQNKNGVPIDFDALLRRFTVRMSGRGSFLMPVASALIILALLATFDGMKNATDNLSQSLEQAGKQDALKNKDASRTEENLRAFTNAFTNRVTDALKDMGHAFGANLMSVFFSAMLALLVPVLRKQQRSAVEAFGDVVEEVLRPHYGRNEHFEKTLAEVMAKANEGTLSVYRERVAEDTTRIVEAFEAVGKRMDEFNRTIVASLEGEVEETKTRLREEQQARLSANATGLERVSTNFQTFAAAFASNSQRIDVVVRKLTDANGQMGEVRDHLKKTSEQVLSAYERAEEVIKGSTNDFRSELKTRVDNWVKVVGGAEDVARLHSDALAASVRTMEESVRELTRQQVETRATINQTPESIRGILTEFQAQGAAEQARTELMRALADDIRGVVSQAQEQTRGASERTLALQSKSSDETAQLMAVTNDQVAALRALSQSEGEALRLFASEQITASRGFAESTQALFRELQAELRTLRKPSPGAARGPNVPGLLRPLSQPMSPTPGEPGSDMVRPPEPGPGAIPTAEDAPPIENTVVSGPAPTGGE